MEIFDVSLGFDVGIGGDFEVIMGATRSGTMGAVKGLSRSSTDDNDGNGGSDDDNDDDDDNDGNGGSGNDDDGNGTDDDDPVKAAVNPLSATRVLLGLLSL